jgi:hypothetical protein
VVFEEFFDEGAVLTDGDADDGELFGTVFGVEFIERGTVGTAGWAPGGPEIEEDGAAFEVGKAEGLAGEIGDGEIGGGFAGELFFHAGGIPGGELLDLFPIVGGEAEEGGIGVSTEGEALEGVGGIGLKAAAAVIDILDGAKGDEETGFGVDEEARGTVDKAGTVCGGGGAVPLFEGHVEEDALAVATGEAARAAFDFDGFGPFGIVGAVGRGGGFVLFGAVFGAGVFAAVFLVEEGVGSVEDPDVGTGAGDGFFAPFGAGDVKDDLAFGGLGGLGGAEGLGDFEFLMEAGEGVAFCLELTPDAGGRRRGDGS